jgi:hypothetical protein
MDYGGETIRTENPEALTIGVWKPVRVQIPSLIVNPDQTVPGRVEITPSAVNFHGGNGGMIVWAEGIDNTGGHIHPHNANHLPAGTCFDIAGNTPGYVYFNYTASPFGQIEAVKARACDITATGQIIFVMIVGLVAIPASDNYGLIGGLPDHPEHPDNHYLTPAARNSLLTAINQYNDAQGTTNLVQINDCSLVGGGLFDHEVTWAPPHSKHRLGRNADLRMYNLTAYELGVLRSRIEYNGGVWEIHNGNHIHVSF